MRLIRIIPVPAKKGHRYRTNLILFLATVATVITAGYFFATDPALRYLAPNINVPLTITLYALSILAIFGLHEFGHKVAAWRHGIPSSLPYFIPGYPPSGGTFGALILQDSPPVNRDALFDLGISGPLVGLAVTIPVIILGLTYSFPVSPAQNATLTTKFGVGNFGVPILFNLLQSIFVNIPSNYTLYIHPVAFAGWLGLLVTFLNTLPIAQLDGGHVFRAVLSEKWHRYASYAGLVVLVLSGFLFFAILVFLLFMRAKHPGALDDVSKLSLTRKIVLIIFPVIWVLAYPMMGLFF
jgi:membrane-associated protease RseP (regulator of RpoE activity)